MSAEIIKELMEKYDLYRKRYINDNGSDFGFDDWFREQVLNEKR